MHNFHILASYNFMTGPIKFLPVFCPVNTRVTRKKTGNDSLVIARMTKCKMTHDATGLQISISL